LRAESRRPTRATVSLSGPTSPTPGGAWWGSTPVLWPGRRFPFLWACRAGASRQAVRHLVPSRASGLWRGDRRGRSGGPPLL